MKTSDRLSDIVDRALQEAQERGQMKEFNRAYHAYRSLSEVAGHKPMHYRTARKRLKDWICCRIKEGKPWGVDRPMIELVLSGKNFY